MTSRSRLKFSERAEGHRSPVACALFKLAERKKTTLVLSADVTTTQKLLELADKLGPYIAILKTHIDIVSDFSPYTIQGLLELRTKHDFLIFEDRKFVDIGHTVQLQYHGGSLRISDWADIVNCTLLPGPGIVQALAETVSNQDFSSKGQRALLILAEMTSKGSLATGAYTEASVAAARSHPEFVMGFVSTKSLETVNTKTMSVSDEDFVVFTTGINIAVKGDALGQQYQTPQSAVSRGADFIIAGRGIYEASDPIQAAKLYRDQGWEAYLSRTSVPQGEPGQIRYF